MTYARKCIYSLKATPKTVIYGFIANEYESGHGGNNLGPCGCTSVLSLDIDARWYNNYIYTGFVRFFMNQI